MKKVAAFAVMLALAPLPALAQMVEDIKFEPGNYGTLISGSVTGNDYFDYRLEANAGQQLFVELSVQNTNGDGVVYFNILPPGSSGETIFTGSMEAEQVAKVQLPKSGPYTIRVYLMGNDRDTDKTVSYNVDVSIQ